MNKFFLFVVISAAVVGAFFSGRIYEYLFVDRGSDTPVTSQESPTLQKNESKNSSAEDADTSPQGASTSTIVNPVISTSSLVLTLDALSPNDAVRSPLIISGVASGPWFFEASFPITIYDAEGHQIGQSIAQAQEDWMTTDAVRFSSRLTFEMPPSDTGEIVFKKDNPSGLPEHDYEVRVPIRFYRSTEPASIVIDSPLNNQVVTSPLLVTGSVVGWYFEGDFPVWLEDDKGTILSRGYATAQDDWMAIEYVPFQTKLFFDAPKTGRGFVVFEEGDPSLLNPQQHRVPVRFE